MEVGEDNDDLSDVDDRLTGRDDFLLPIFSLLTEGEAALLSGETRVALREAGAQYRPDEYGSLQVARDSFFKSVKIKKLDSRRGKPVHPALSGLGQVW